MSLMQWTWLALALLGASLWLPGVASAQGNFEIQVYGSETVEPGTTMVELHSNVAIKGTTTKEDGIFPTQHAAHETIEITHGFTPWFETGFYLFTSIIIPCRTYGIDLVDIATFVIMLALEQSHHGEPPQRGYRKNCTVLCRSPAMALPPLDARQKRLI